MTVMTGQAIRAAKIIDPLHEREKRNGSTFGLGPAGYDLRLVLDDDLESYCIKPGEFMLAAAEERFTMPNNVIGYVHDKSSFARRGLSVFNTVIEPGWEGYLTLELINHGPESILLYAGQGIAQVTFHRTEEPVEEPYSGKYQDQEWGPQGART